MNLGLTDKIVFITGASGGIGQAIAQAFVEEGALVIAGFKGREYKISDWALTLPEDQQKRVFPVKIDLNDTAALSQNVADLVATHHRIDVLINCAGSAIEKPFLLMDDDEIERQVHDNFTGHIQLTQRVLKQMLAQKSGAIVNISSILGSQFGRGATVYASAKSAIERFTQALSLEVGRKGIRINCVCPGMIDTKMTSELKRNMPDEIVKMSPISRPGTPREVADAVLFLASDLRASYITGTSLAVNGGLGI